jgi:hypothetical protein
MTMTATLTALGASLALAAFFGWMGARPPDLKRGPRLLPYRFLMLMTAAAALFLLVHVVNLLGVTTGR